MKKWVVLIIACLFSNILSQTNISPQFSELKGMEDQQGNTHLFYRVYLYQPGGPIGNYFENSIYHLDLGNTEDTLFLFEGGRIGDAFVRIVDLEYWNNNPAEFIYLGEGVSVDPVPFIQRFDTPDPTYTGLGEAFSLELSKQNSSLVIASAPYMIESTDGGFNWIPFLDSLFLKILSINPYNDNDIFFGGGGFDLGKTTDGGLTISLVDTNHQGYQFFYDVDNLHIYSLGNNELIVSDNKGNAFSWTYRYTSPNRIFISHDYAQSGKFFLADEKRIYVTEDYGNNFSLYKTLERKIVGIYKKPNSDKLYAATKYKIYEITPDTIQVIKSLPIPDEVLSFYPLAIGNKWVYDEVTVVQDPYPNVYFRILVKEVLGDTIAPNGKHYYRVNDETIWESSVLERVDSIEGRIYRYYEDPSLPENEYLAYDLLAEVGDTISSYRMGFNTVMFTTMYAETSFEKWGLIKPKKVFEEYTLHPPIFSLTQDIGLDSIYFYFDFGNTWITLKGCIINGIVYGDTTTVGVEDEENPIATTFRLEQNYPNPFNPTTKIKFTIPSNVKREMSNVTLKVYDILGNEIATLVNEELPAGEYEVEFSSHSDEGQNLSTGIYFYQLVIRGSEINSEQALIQTKKMILLK